VIKSFIFTLRSAIGIAAPSVVFLSSFIQRWCTYSDVHSRPCWQHLACCSVNSRQRSQI